ncbi:FAD-binding protein [Parvibacter caecicola]|uniref:FAD-binding protein n=1 Tax=Parvibacter caecicola TaxID=747645 RepID=UPI00272FE2EF|nr:FAD-binding protein [Parvibacter caecicola]
MSHMEEAPAKGLSRRAFLSLGAAAAAVAAGSSLTGCAPTPRFIEGNSMTYGEAEGQASAGTNVIHNVKDTSWMTQPTEVTDFAAEYDCDAVVCGLGFAGTTASRELAEQGKKVIVIEKQPEDTYAATGNEFASLNAAILKKRGVPAIDPVEFYQNFMKITSNMPNPSLVMKFAQNSEANSNWYLEPLSEEDFATMTTAFFPPTEHQMSELSGIKFWPSVCSFYGGCNQTKIVGMNHDIAKQHGAEFLYGTTGEYLIMEDGKVAGIVAKSDAGYIKVNCRAVVLSCGGMGGNPEMMAYFMPDMAQALVEGEQLSSMSANDGRGVQMAYWAGAHLETTPIAGMNMKGLSLPGKMNCLPQAVWVDENGKRFCNEYYPTSEQRGYQTTFMSRKTKFAICDNNFPEYRQYTLPQHAGFTASEENIASLREALDTAYAKFNGTYVEPESSDSQAQGGEGGGQNGAVPAAAAGAAAGGAPGGAPGGEGGAPGGEGGEPKGGPMGSVDYIADDTLEGLAGQLGLTGDAATAFVEQIARWNEYCESGVDLEFGRDPKVLFPVKEPPFYACTFDPELGETMVTMGGIITNGEQNALDANYEPIPGLYVSGNDCGRRFGTEYVTPIPGVSIAFAMVLGRECGKSVAEFLG